jgi:nicotinamide mononucleotide adenylyltransferase
MQESKGSRAMTETGVIHGRFQVLHNDHMKYLLEGKSRCSHLVIGITNPDPSLTRDDPADPKRSLPDSNPLTYYERYVLVKSAMREAGVRDRSFSVVPFPINCPELYSYYVPLDAVFYLTVYDNWGRRKLEQFQAQGLKTEILWTRSREEKGLSSADIRALMIRGDPWEHLVPSSVAHYLKLWDVPSRLRNMVI